MADPWAGSYMMETLTKELSEEALKIINEVEEMGGMTKAILTGMPKMRIEESAARRQAKIDSGFETIVGVNKYRMATQEKNYDVLKIDNTEVRRKQIERLQSIKKTRDEQACYNALNALTEAAKSGKGNLLELSVNAAKVRATVGEISYALEKVYGRHQAKDQIVRGAYSKESLEKAGDKGKIEYEESLAKV